MIETRRQESVGIMLELDSPRKAALPWWLSTSVILGALLMAAGATIALIRPAMLVAPGAEINAATRVYAGYLVSRNLALALMLLAMLAVRARGVLSSLMVLTAFIQLFDAAMDAMEGRWPIVPGVLVFAIVFFLGAARLSGPFWKIAAWRDAPQQAAQ
jgi:hypothetical protein